MAPLDSVLTLLSPDGECEVLGELSVAEVRDDLFAKVCAGRELRSRAVACGYSSHNALTLLLYSQGPMHEVMVRPAFTAGKMQMTWGSAQWESTPVSFTASQLQHCCKWVLNRHAPLHYASFARSMTQPPC